jgi:hypothetical protein
MIHSRELQLRELAAQQECQAEIRAQSLHLHLGDRTWSPAVAAGFLAIATLMAVSLAVVIVVTIH